jgi:hypothetical protein
METEVVWTMTGMSTLFDRDTVDGFTLFDRDTVDGTVDTHTDIILNGDTPEVDSQVGQGDDVFPVAVVIHRAVRDHLVDVAGEATGCPESNLATVAETAVAVCS